MNSQLPWWTTRWSSNLSHLHSTLSSRLARAIIAAALTGTPALVPVPVYGQSTPATPTPTPQIKVDSSALPRSTGAITSFAPIVDKVGPSIVTIFTTKEVKQQPNDLDANPMLRRFFGIPDDSGPDGDQGDQPGLPGQPSRPGRGNRGNRGGGGGSDKVMGLGSGVIVSADGLILTNNHVAEAGDEIKVRIGDHGHEYTAKKVGNDPTSDLALLRIDAKNLPVMTFADSDQVKVGDLVLAVGSPFGLTNTVTMGIVSALGRGGMGITDYENFIQTDASINPGNSGGALIDTQGRLIGINTAIYSRTGGNQGIGFSVPSNLVRTVMDSLMKNGKVTRGFLGIELEPALTPDLAQEFKAPADQEGALIDEVIPGDAADKAGMQNGDIITQVNGKSVDDGHSLQLAIGGLSPGTKVTLTFLREGQTKTSDVTLGDKSSNGELATNAPPEQGKSNVLDGITVGDLDASARTELKVPDEVKGVLVTDVAADSVGNDVGLKKGDVILDMNHKPMTSADVAVNEGNNIEKTERVLIHVWSDGRMKYLVLKPKDS